MILALNNPWIFICHLNKKKEKSRKQKEENQLRSAFNNFVQAFKIVVESWKFTMLLLYILWDERPFFMISGSKEQLQQQLEYTLLKSDYHSWWISKMQLDVRTL